MNRTRGRNGSERRDPATAMPWIGLVASTGERDGSVGERAVVAGPGLSSVIGAE